MSQVKPQLSVIIPVFNDRANLQQCLDALAKSILDHYEVILVDDGSTDGSDELARQRADQFLGLQQNMGQAEARNRGARLASSDLLFFLDADVTVEPDTLRQIVRVMDENTAYSAMFCSYQPDTTPQNFVSQYKNLLHHYTHQVSRTEAVTFCGGFGAIRRDAFLESGGFDRERRFMEDVDLGYRLHKAGHRIMSCPWIQLTHNKRYSLGSLVKSDVMQRAIPWTHVMLQRRMFQNDLNTSRHNIISLVVVYVMTVLPFAPVDWAVKAVVEVLLLALLVVLNRRFLGFLARQKGVLFALRSLGMIFLQHLYSGVGLAAGVLTYAWSRVRGK